MKLVFQILLILVAIVALTVLFYLGSFYYWLRQSVREVASNVNISTDWLELAPQPRLKVTKHVQSLIVLVDGYRRGNDDTRNQIPLPDGTLVNPEVEILDDSGKVYRLHPSRLVSAGVGYTADHSFPRDKSFVKIRIRSDKPFQASKILWENMNLK